MSPSPSTKGCIILVDDVGVFDNPNIGLLGELYSRLRVTGILLVAHPLLGLRYLDLEEHGRREQGGNGAPCS
jgi:hypothetical protein